jgi:ABC-type sugar transport system substrate-binding protein
VSVYSAERDTAVQVRQVQAVLNESGYHPAAILVSPVREAALVGVARDALSKQIPWTFLCRWSDSVRQLRAEFPDVTVCAVSADQASIGRMQGQLSRVLLREDEEILYVQGLPGTSSAERRLAATREELMNLAARFSVVHGDWSADSGSAAMQRWLQGFSGRSVPKFLVVAQNDNMAFGARKALIEWAGDRRGVDGIRIIGCDGVPNFGQRMVNEGVLTATVVVPSVAGRAIEQVLSGTRSAQRGTPEELLVSVTSHPEPMVLMRRSPSLAS